jgi:hypothetical protein
MAIPGTDSAQGQGVRTISPGDVAAKIVDATTPSQGLGVDTSGRITIKLDDGSGNLVTSQVNGTQRALDIGINVAGVQIDPRAVGQYNSALPTLSSGTFASPQLNASGVLYTASVGDTLPSTLSVTTQDIASTSTVSGTQTFVTGTPTAGSAAVFTLASQETLMVEITGTWTGTLQSEISVDGGTTWITHAIHLIGTPLFIASFTSNAIGSLNAAAKTTFRIRSTAAMTGSATIKVIESLNPSSVYVANAIKLVDGSSATSTNTLTIKSASTAAAATDTSAVVALSPNSPLPAGTNAIGSVLANLQVASAPVSVTNPVPVILSSSLPGNPVNNYFMSTTNLAYGASDTHLYTITSGKTFNIKKFWAAASGRIRIDVQVSTNGSTFTTVFTGYNSTVNPNISIDMNEFAVSDSGTGAAVQIIRYNEEVGQTFGISSTISGTEN